MGKKKINQRLALLKKVTPRFLCGMAASGFRKRSALRSIPSLKPLECAGPPGYIVSLTSYGKRISAITPYAVITLLDQSVRPDKVVLWIAHGDRENVPPVLEKLVEKGLEICYCDDTRSYKKLIPSLERFPGACIITADDDVFYPRDWLSQLLAEHRKNPKKIICHRAHGIRVDGRFEPLPYGEWDACIDPRKYFAPVSANGGSVPRHPPEAVFPTGVAGVLYPPGCLAADVTNRELFTKLAPMADDIWFWAMAAINEGYFGGENPYAVIENSCTRNLWYVDVLLQLRGNALWNYNRSQGGNDIQLRAVIDRYPRIRERLRKIGGMGGKSKD